MRERMVTRTVKSLNVTFICLDTESAEVSNETIIVPINLKDNEKKILAYGHKHIDTDTVKAVSIVNIEETEGHYKMTEAKFIELADKD